MIYYARVTGSLPAFLRSPVEVEETYYSSIHSLIHSFIHYQIHSKYPPQARHYSLEGIWGLWDMLMRETIAFFYTDRNGIVEEEL